MLSNEIFSLLKKHNLIDKSTELPNDWDEEDYGDEATEIARGLFDIFLKEKSISYAGMYEESNWDWKDLINIYKSILNNYIKSSSGNIKLENLLCTGIASADNYADSPMTIDFYFNNQNFSWSFTLNNSSFFYDNVTKWAQNAFNNNIMFLGGEMFDAYLVPKELVHDLSKLEISSSVNYFSQ